jgi:hypothetical protein
MEPFVDIKKDLTNQLIDVLTPPIYEGIQSIYKKAKETSVNDKGILKNFQKFLEKIVEWDENRIITEKNRIVNCSKCSDYTEDLIKSVIKINLIVKALPLYNNESDVKPQFLNRKFYDTIDIGKFIQTIYIECAREFWNNPYLMFVENDSIDVNKSVTIIHNKKDSLLVINKSIKKAINVFLPVKNILKEFLDKEEFNIFKLKTETVIKDPTTVNLSNDNKNGSIDKFFDKNINLKEPEKLDIHYETEQNIIDLIKKSKMITDTRKSTEMRSNISKVTNSEKKKIVEDDLNHESDTSTSYVNGKINDELFEDVYSNTHNNKVLQK